MKKNYLKNILILLFIIIIVICFIKYLRRGHIAKYKIKNDGYTFEIIETRTRNEKKEIDNYYLEISVNNSVFTYELFDEFDSKHKIIKNIYYFRDKNYTCVYPVLYGNYNVDIKCLNGSIYYYYHDLVGKDAKLDEFANSLKRYKLSSYSDIDSKVKNEASIRILTDNLVDSHNVAITTLKGIYSINDHKQIKLFENDIYSRPISIIADDYYLVADYTEKHQFRTFTLIDLSNLKKHEIKSSDYISMNSYIQGVVDGYVYLYDPDNEVQYEVNLSRRKISKVNNKKNKVDFYQNGEWKEISTVKANNIAYFPKNIIVEEFSDYDLVYKYGNKQSGFYYLYEKEDDHYKVYRSPVQNIHAIEYIFDVKDIDSIIYLDDYVYFINDNSIYYYHQTTGVRKIIEYDELKFNDKLIYGVVKVK
ncbi:MAG: hypothetical protein IKN87_02925 [Bacilli bacterium]|nr:hypothetical protein [Bacilli bacterium]